MEEKLSAIEEIFPDETLQSVSGFDSAIIGYAENFNEPVRLIYSVSKCIEILTKDMSHEEAVEYFEFNISGAYMGENTPIWCHDDHN